VIFDPDGDAPTGFVGELQVGFACELLVAFASEPLGGLAWLTTLVCGED